MKNPIHKLRRFFVRSRTYNAAAAARAAMQTPHEEDEGGNRLSGAFIVVLVLHVIAVVGVFAFARIKESRSSNTPQTVSTQTAAAKSAPAKPAPAKTTTATATIAAASPPQIAPHDAPKISTPAARTTHIVREGETLTKIATQYSVGVSDFVSLNKLKSQDDIHKGQALAIPSTKQPQKSPLPAEIKPAQTAAQKNTPAPADHKTPKTYIVRKGDTPLKIAREHGCTYDELMKVNSIKDPKKIQPGQTLKLPVKNG